MFSTWQKITNMNNLVKLMKTVSFVKCWSLLRKLIMYFFIRAYFFLSTKVAKLSPIYSAINLLFIYKIVQCMEKELFILCLWKYYVDKKIQIAKLNLRNTNINTSRFIFLDGRHHPTIKYYIESNANIIICFLIFAP